MPILLNALKGLPMIDYRSSEIHSIMAALAKAQGAYKPLVANEYWSGAKYANLQAIMQATRSALADNNLAFYQYTELHDEGTGAKLLRSVLGHESGQYISSYARIISGETDRQTGNSLEINKRQQALMLLGIAPINNDPAAFDDNGEEQNHERLIEAIKQGKDRPEPDMSDTITKQQYEDLLIELHGFDNIVKDILATYGIKTMADIPKQEYHPIIRKVRMIKKNLSNSDDYAKSSTRQR